MNTQGDDKLTKKQIEQMTRLIESVGFNAIRHRSQTDVVAESGIVIERIAELLIKPIINKCSRKYKEKQKPTLLEWKSKKRVIG